MTVSMKCCDCKKKITAFQRSGSNLISHYKFVDKQRNLELLLDQKDKKRKTAADQTYATASSTRSTSNFPSVAKYL